MRSWLTGLGRAKIAAVTLAAVLLVAVLGTFWPVWPASPKAYATAHFSRAVGLYAGSDVRVLGVRVGKVERVVPEGTTVRVDFEYDARRKLPASVRAAIISPSVVSDRYLQLFPVYRSGPTLADHADIPLASTAVPVELDRMMSSLDNLSVALGPEGANRTGSLSRLVDTGAKNLAGQGEQLHQTLTDLASAVNTLSGSRGDMFATVRNLQAFTTALATNDTQVRAFNQDLASVADQLDGERRELAAALENLATAVGQVRSFVADNRAMLKSNVDALTKITQVLVNQKASLTEFLDVAPTALSNLQLAYNPTSGTLDTRPDLLQLNNPAAFLCQLLATSTGGNPDTACSSLSKALAPLSKLTGAGGGGSLGGRSPLGAAVPSTGSTSAWPAASGAGRDLTLGGILEAQ